ncbi:MAG: hypothetical protein ACFCVF_05030 [Kineosporiaceae bacterium]
MTGRPLRLLLALAVWLYTAVHVVLALSVVPRPVDPSLSLLGLGLLVLASTAVLWWPPPGLRLPYAVIVTALTVTAAVCVLAVLPPGRPGYALWYPSLVPVALGGVAVRGHPRLAVGAALGVAVLTTAWAAQYAGGVAEGLYRTVTPTAGVVVLAGAATVHRDVEERVTRARAEQQAATEMAAGLQARERERQEQTALLARRTVPVLTRLAAGEPVDSRLAADCLRLESAVRDALHGRRLVDEAVAAAAHAARSRGVTVTLLDDGEGRRATDSDAVARTRRLVADVLARLADGALTARISPRGTTVATVLVTATDVRAAVDGVAGPGVRVDVDGDEALVVVTA